MKLTLPRLVGVILVSALIVSAVLAWPLDEMGGDELVVSTPQSGFHWVYTHDNGSLEVKHVGPARIIDHDGAPRDSQLVRLAMSVDPGTDPINDTASANLDLFVTEDFRYLIASRTVYKPDEQPSWVERHQRMIWYPYPTPWLAGASEFWGQTLEFDGNGNLIEHQDSNWTGTWNLRFEEGHVVATPEQQPIVPRFASEDVVNRSDLKLDPRTASPSKIGTDFEQIGSWSLGETAVRQISDRISMTGANDSTLALPTPEDRSRPMPYDRDPSYQLFPFSEMIDVLDSRIPEFDDDTLIATARVCCRGSFYAEHGLPLPLLPDRVNYFESMEWTVYITKDGDDLARGYNVEKQENITGEVTYGVDDRAPSNRSGYLVDGVDFRGKLVALDEVADKANEFFPDDDFNGVRVYHRPYDGLAAQTTFAHGASFTPAYAEGNGSGYAYSLEFDASTGGLLSAINEPDVIESLFVIALPEDYPS